MEIIHDYQKIVGNIKKIKSSEENFQCCQENLALFPMHVLYVIDYYKSTYKIVG